MKCSSRLRRVFALGTEGLREGGEALLNTGGAVIDALLSAAGGLRQARNLQQQLLTARDGLAPIRKSEGKPFYKAFRDLQQANDALRRALYRPDEWARQEEALANARRRRHDANDKAREAASRMRRLERIRRVRPLLAKYDAASAWLDSNPTIPGIPADLRLHLTAAREELARASFAVDQARVTFDRLDEQARTAEVRTSLRDEETTIDRLVGDRCVAAQAAERLPQVRTARQLSRRRIAGQLRDLGSDFPVDEAAAILPSRAGRAEAKRLIEAYSGAVAALDGLPARIAKEQQTLRDTRERLAALPPEADVMALQRLTAEIRRPGDPLTTATQARVELRTKEAALQAALAKVPGWTAGGKRLRRALPSGGASGPPCSRR
ncbi:MAG TPA: AAA family ATPase [Crenalkalicoccus sp.]|nr:AAA family ATPase [Crenalkalicoccus sp.]